MFEKSPGRHRRVAGRAGRHQRSRLPRAWTRIAVVLLATAAAVMVGEAAWAQEPPDAPGVESIPQVVDRMRLWLVGILFSVAGFFFTLGAFRRLWSNGDPGELEKANAAFRNAGIGLALALLAPLIVTIVAGFVA